MNDNDREFGLLNGFSPTAHGVLLVDFDGTLFPFGELFSDSPPLPGAAEAMRKLKAMGYTLRIFSSRLASTWLNAAGEDPVVQQVHMEHLLAQYDIPYDGFAYEKDPAQFYIDDRAIEFKNNWKEIVSRLSRHAPERSA